MLFFKGFLSKSCEELINPLKLPKEKEGRSYLHYLTPLVLQGGLISPYF